MRTVGALFIAFIAFFTSNILSSAEYGGRWTDESIREYSLKYIEGTKERFSKRAARLSEVVQFTTPVEYRELTPEQKEFYEKFLQDRISSQNREKLLRMILRDLEAVRAKLAEAEKEASEVWEKLPKEEREKKGLMIKGEIYGTEISSSNLGVLLDNSPSMRPYLDAVRVEISNSFPEAQFREAAESGLHQRLQRDDAGKRSPLDDSWYYGEMPTVGVNPFSPIWHQTKIHESIAPHYRQVGLERNALPALLALIKLQKVDTLYWFCDFEDDIDEPALELLADALKTHQVKLYVHSSNRRPKKAITEIIEASGGEVIRKRIR